MRIEASAQFCHEPVLKHKAYYMKKNENENNFENVVSKQKCFNGQFISSFPIYR